jgi:hypothetical protein
MLNGARLTSLQNGHHSFFQWLQVENYCRFSCPWSCHPQLIQPNFSSEQILWTFAETTKRTKSKTLNNYWKLTVQTQWALDWMAVEQTQAPLPRSGSLHNTTAYLNSLSLLHSQVQTALLACAMNSSTDSSSCKEYHPEKPSAKD